jgi:hypothetical protein
MFLNISITHSKNKSEFKQVAHLPFFDGAEGGI